MYTAFGNYLIVNKTADGARPDSAVGTVTSSTDLQSTKAGLTASATVVFLTANAVQLDAEGKVFAVLAPMIVAKVA